jgi:hypothetical protein
MFLFIAVLIFSFTFQPAKPIIVVRDDNIPFVPVRRLTLNPWLGENSLSLQEQTMTSRMEKASYDLREGLSF